MAEKKTKPALRFKGFTDDWEKHKLEDIVDFLDAQRKPLEEGKREKGFYPYYGASGIVDYVAGYLFDEELILLSEDGANITDRNYPVCFLASGKYWVNNHAHVLKAKSGYDNNFICNSMERKDYSNYNTGMAMPKLNQEVCRFIPVACPIFDEQRLIGDYLRNLDNLIAFHQHKHEKLVNIKKSMLKKMFPQNGSAYPEIRFSGFTAPWEQRKFSDITFPSGEKNRDNLPYESYSITNESGFVRQDEKFENGGTMRDADKRMYYIVSPESFAYNPARINVGSIGYQNTSKNVIVSSLYEVFKTTDDVDDRFLWHWFKSDDFRKLIVQLQEGGVRLYFYYDKLCMGEMALPSLAEQSRIGVYLDKLDNLITLHQCKLDRLKNLKKSMLQRMFV